ncbi:MAG: hypothetical protein ACFFAO_13140 [Candidatus Hermodarchaeota archaeon]
MPEINICSICGEKTIVFECSNEECGSYVCEDCSNDYIAPMIEYFYQCEPLPILKCPNCGKNLIKDF